MDLLCHNSASGRRRIDFARWDLDGFYGTDFDSTRYSDASQHWCTNRGEEIHVGDFNGDGRDDLLCHVKRGNPNYGRRRIDFANNVGTFFGTDFNSESYPDASQHWCTNRGEEIHVGDFNGDGRDDLLCHVKRGNPNYGRRRIDFANSAGTLFGTDWNSEGYSSASQHWCTNAGEKIYVGDFNGDGRDDLLCHVSRGNTSYGRRRIDFANSAGTLFGTDWNSESYSSASQHWCTNAGESIHVGDFNDDGKDDLLCFRASDGRMRIDHANSAGTFFGTNASSSEDWCGGSNQALHVGDFSGDGRTDLICHDNVTGDRRLRYANSSGDFRSVCSDGAYQGDGTLLPIGLHFVVLSNPNHATVTNRAARMPTATSTHTHPLTGTTINQSSDPSAYFRAELELINSHMHDTSNNPLCDGSDCLSFEYAGHTLYSETTGSSCSALLKLGNPPNARWARDCEDTGTNICGEGSVASSSWSRTLKNAILECTDVKLRKPGVVNFYILDQCNWDSSVPGGLSNSSCGRTISNGKSHPTYAVAAAYERLFRGSATGDELRARGVEHHELGHVFGLGHVWDGCVSSTNAMNKRPGGEYCGNSAPTCTQPSGIDDNGDRLKGFSTSVVPWDFDDVCSTVNQITKMIGKAREAQVHWSCP